MDLASAAVGPATASLERRQGRCLHCGIALGSIGLGGAGSEGEGSNFCCRGCARVYDILRSAGLDRYYELRDEPGIPVGERTASDPKWLEPIEERLATADGLEHVRVDVQGVHCAACVWLIQSLFEREPHGARCVVNPGRGTIELDVRPNFDLRHFVQAVEDVGYRLGPPLKGTARESDSLTLRMGISIALAANTMVLSLAIYFGLAGGPLHALARQVGFALSSATVFIGGSYFIGAAWRSLRRGLFHLDLPIAIGIALSFVGSAWSFFHGGAADFFDTLAVFIALMLVGRWAQERLIARNRAQLLASDGVEGLYARKVEGDRPVLTRCVDLRSGDTLLLASGDLVPVDLTLAAPAQLRLDWIHGESAPRAYERGDVAPAGAFVTSRHAVRGVLRSDFADSPLIELLQVPDAREDRSSFWDRLSKGYVALVLAAATGAFVLWMRIGSFTEALTVTTAVLVVTCPCAFGIAVPLAQELVQAALRRSGLFVRTTSLLSRVPSVRRVVFDKTGTLTTGVPQLADRGPIEALDEEARQRLMDLAGHSTHPKAMAVARAAGGEVRADAVVEEAPSRGLQLREGGHLYRLGRPSWAAPERRFPLAIDLVFARDGEPLAALSTQEELRGDAAQQVRALEAMGREVWILSGDAPDKVRVLAKRLGIPAERAVGGRDPEQKAAWLRQHRGHEAMFVGDGINDSLATEAALVSGTPAIDRPFMAARTDFYFVTPGLAPIGRLLEWSHRLRAVIRANLGFALAYNLGAVALAYAGLVEPWVAAILMPVSSSVTLTATSAALLNLDRRRTSWTS